LRFLGNPAAVEIFNDGKLTEGETRLVKLQLAAESTHLQPGESSELYVRATGLLGFEETLKIQLDNFSEQNVRLEGGDHQTILATSADIVGDIFQWSTVMTGLQIGAFSIQAKVVNETFNPTDPLEEDVGQKPPGGRKWCRWWIPNGWEKGCVKKKDWSRNCFQSNMSSFTDGDVWDGGPVACDVGGVNDHIF
jgi:hypothetical protein